jgi:hypothetical protein
VADEEVHDVVADLDRDVPVALRRQAEHVEFRGRVPRGPVRVHRQLRAGHVGPAEQLERAGGSGVDRVLREDGETELTGEGPEPVRVVRTANGVVVVQVEPGRNARVRRRSEEVLVAGQLGEHGDGVGVAVGPGVELVDQEHVGVVGRDDVEDGIDLGGRISGQRRGQIGVQHAGGASVQAGVECGEAHRVGPSSLDRCSRPGPRGDGTGGERERNEEALHGPNDATWCRPPVTSSRHG